MTIQTRIVPLAGAALLTLTAINADAAESGFFMGGSIGTAAVEANVNDGIVLPDPPPVFDENDFGWKFLAGYDFALSETFSLGRYSIAPSYGIDRGAHRKGGEP